MKISTKFHGILVIFSFILPEIFMNSHEILIKSSSQVHGKFFPPKFLSARSWCSFQKHLELSGKFSFVKMFGSRRFAWPFWSKFTSSLTANLFGTQLLFFLVAMMFHPTQNRILSLKKSQKDNHTAKSFIFQQVALQYDLKPFANKILETFCNKPFFAKLNRCL